ncbi:hypothetical protein DRE_04651 [Drechslerella stenobrocha 248]|uniref:Uncharacterized protein n=1 Tax=Drechslerella stenobrocha 248 TaxID=1043628 RepID=W7I0R6_9PEZI|nr:hypothetical protein DRE_04651 [Drechslerella stenobrocha 248]
MAYARSSASVNLQVSETTVDIGFGNAQVSHRVTEIHGSSTSATLKGEASYSTDIISRTATPASESGELQVWHAAQKDAKSAISCVLDDLGQRLNREFEVIQAINDGLEAQVASLRVKAAGLEKENADLKAENEKHSLLKDDYERLEAEVGRLIAENKTLEESRDSETRRPIDPERLKAEISRLAAENNTLRETGRRNEILMDSCRKLEAETKWIEAENEMLEKGIRNTDTPEKVAYQKLDFELTQQQLVQDEKYKQGGRTSYLVIGKQDIFSDLEVEAMRLLAENERLKGHAEPAVAMDICRQLEATEERLQAKAKQLRAVHKQLNESHSGPGAVDKLKADYRNLDAEAKQLAKDTSVKWLYGSDRVRLRDHGFQLQDEANRLLALVASLEWEEEIHSPQSQLMDECHELEANLKWLLVMIETNTLELIRQSGEPWSLLPEVNLRTPPLRIPRRSQTPPPPAPTRSQRSPTPPPAPPPPTTPARSRRSLTARTRDWIGSPGSPRKEDTVSPDSGGIRKSSTATGREGPQRKSLSREVAPVDVDFGGRLPRAERTTSRGYHIPH